MCSEESQNADCGVLLFTGKGGIGSDEHADCGVLCVQGKGGMLTVVCFVFMGKAGGGSDGTKMLTVVCFVFR